MSSRAWFASALAACAVCGVLGGCLVSETQETRLSVARDGRRGRLSYIKRNLQSDATSDSARHKDFQESVEEWSRDSVAQVERALGIVLRRRTLRIEGGVLVERQTWDLPDVHRVTDLLGERPMFGRDSSRFELSTRDSLEFTNGAVTRGGDSTVVRWPRSARELVLRTRNRDFHPTTSFADSFRAWKRTH